MRGLWMAGLLILAGCASDETVAGFTGTDLTWQATGASGMTLRFRSGGRVSGSTPCGDFSGEQTAPYPWFELTLQKVPDAPCNIDVLQLSTMTQSEVSGDTLLLSNDAGISLEFQAIQE